MPAFNTVMRNDGLNMNIEHEYEYEYRNNIGPYRLFIDLCQTNALMHIRTNIEAPEQLANARDARNGRQRVS